MRVDVYRNLHKGKRGEYWYSVKDRGTGKVVDRVEMIVLRNCEFVVSQAGRERCLREKRKNVHAFVRGWTIDNMMDAYIGNPTEVTYNPYKYSGFVTKYTEQPVTFARYVMIYKKEVYAYI